MHIIHGDIRNPTKFQQKIPKTIDYFIHLAWLGNTGADRSNENLQLLDISCTLNLIHILHNHNLKKFISTGTLAEYDILNAYRIDGMKLSPQSRYAASKLSTHLFSKITCNQLGIDYIWCTLANVYGPGDRTSNIVNYSINIFKNNLRASFTEGKQLYDLINISDLTSALLLIIEKGIPDVEYYIGSGNPQPLRKYIETIRDMVNPQSPIYFGEVPFNGQSLSEKDYNIDRIKELGFVPKIDFESGLSELLQWKLNQE